MSKAVRFGLIGLGLIVIFCATVAFWALTQRQSLQEQNQSLRNEISGFKTQLADLTTQAKKLQGDADQLNNKISQSQQDKTQLQSQYDELKHKSDDLQAQLDQANTDRNDWKTRVDNVSRERDNLMLKLKNRPEKIVYKTIVKAAPVAAAQPMVDVTSPQGDQYWASILKQKAALQIEVEKEKSQLDQAALQVIDLKKQNSDLGVQLKQVNNEKDEIIQKIKYGQDLADNLSIDLARSRNDQQGVNGRADKLKSQNMELLSEIRDLTTTKLELEKTIARLTDDKDAMQKKLVETQSVIQGRIDDIWKIKESLDKKLAQNAQSSSSSGGSMELPPIIVNVPNNQQQSAAQGANPAPTGMGKTEGSIISINGPNNFVIVDLGQENSSVSIGSVLKVYRNSSEIATLEVIQVRRDICAADIKDHSGELRVGDIVKLKV